MTTSIDLADGRVVKTAGVQRDYAIPTRQWPFCRLRKHAGSGHDLSLSVVSSVVFNVGTDKMVCNIRKSVLSESILTFNRIIIH